MKKLIATILVFFCASAYGAFDDSQIALLRGSGIGTASGAGNFTTLEVTGAASFDSTVTAPGITINSTAGATVNNNQVITLIARSSSPVAAPADTSEDILATITLPANTLGITGQLRIQTFFSFTNNANSKTLRVRLGGIGGTAYMTISATTQVTLDGKTIIGNTGTASSQRGYTTQINGGGGATSTIVTSSVNMTGATTLVITGQKATSGDTLQLESYSVELLP